MRYINNTTSPRYCSGANKLLNPGSRSHEINDLLDVASRLIKGAKGFVVQLSKEDRAAIDTLLDMDRKARGADMAKAREAAKDPRGENAVYAQNEALYKAKREAVSKLIKEHEESERRINSESNFIMPDGRPVDTHMDLKSKGKKIEPRFVDKPKSAEEILATNAAISMARSEASDRVASGKEAVAQRSPIPGVPDIPGVDELVKSLSQEAKISRDSRPVDTGKLAKFDFPPDMAKQKTEDQVYEEFISDNGRR